ncbi:glycosyltransferase family 2 protein [Nocardioides sp. Kera G14]|uniref:glycosyltransferase family 2 protein n=1 Tax=Nocardioides sp. Kera G14 TaxID=2884264 RepID=UPI001D100D0B|nr:glycosyltransferase [Nocardioides sp. Kera G14]UDY24522.1 glycosyltransferase [Nocardioides sp. Kera G14]
MLDLLAHALVIGVVLLIPVTVLLFTVRRPAGGRLGVPAAATAAIAAGLVTLGLGALVHLGPERAMVPAAVVTLSVLAWWPVARDWDVRGLVAWAITLDVGVAYLVYVAVWTFSVGWSVGAAVSAVLLVLELFVLLLGVGYVWELVDVLARRRWADPLAVAAGAGAEHRPFVSLHVPTHNEPPELVIETLRTLLALDYDDYEILVVDNNTTDPLLWRPLEEFCHTDPRLVFIHLEDWPGYKSGALNYALTRVDPRTELIGIVDADYHVKREWLRECAPIFADSSVAFVQTPQDYRDWRVSSYFRRLYYSYSYFFDVSQRSRHERNGAIFGGTMGLIRRSALVDAGRWDEWCITEDAELSLRLLRAGGRGVHIDKAYGQGLMPLTFEALKKQRFRWCFGGIQILRLHWRSLMPGGGPDNHLTTGQKWAYLVGGLQWFSDLAGLAFTGFLLAGALNLLLGGEMVIRRLSGLLVLAAVALVVLGAVRAVALVRRSSAEAGWRDAFGAFCIWLALGVTVARASWLGLVSKQGAFLRTPKVKGEPRLRDAVRGNRIETSLAVLTGAGAVAILVSAAGAASHQAVAIMLAIQACGFAAAPLNSLAAIRSDLTEEQQRRRSTAAGIVTPVRRGGAVATAFAGLSVAFVAFAAPVGVQQMPSMSESVHEHLRRPATSARRTPRPSTPASTPAPTGSLALPVVAPPSRSGASRSTGSARSARPTRSPSAVHTTARPTASPTVRATSPTATHSPPGQTKTTTAARPTGRPSTAPTTGATKAAHSPKGKPTASPS